MAAEEQEAEDDTASRTFDDDDVDVVMEIMSMMDYDYLMLTTFKQVLELSVYELQYRYYSVQLTTGKSGTKYYVRWET